MSVVRVLLLLGVLAGCSTDPNPEGSPGDLSVTREDSASVQLVTDPRPSESLAAAWSLPPNPELTLGEADGEGPFLFSRIGDVVPLPGGLLAVADGGSRELRLFGDDGGHVRTLGGEGDGPGRFGAFTDVRRLGEDTLLVWDAVTLRVSHLTPGEGFLRSFPMEVSAGFPPPRVGVTTEGMLVVASGLPDLPDLGRGGWQARNDSVLVQTFAEGGRLIQEIGQFEGTGRASGVVDMGEGRIVIQQPEIPFGHGTHIATLGDRIVVGHNRAFALRVYGREGELEAIWRFPGLVEPLRPAEVDRFRDRAGDGTGARVAAELLDQFGTPSDRPAFDRILHASASSDRIWVRRFRWDPDEEQVWWVISAAGELLGLIRVPAHLDVRAVEDTRLVATTEDDVGVQRIEVYVLAASPDAT